MDIGMAIHENDHGNNDDDRVNIIIMVAIVVVIAQLTLLSLLSPVI